MSNAVFYEDGAFLAAVPSEAWLGPPAVLVAAEEGDASLLSQTLDAVDEIGGLLAPAIASGEALREVVATGRTETLRTWEDVPVSLELPDGDTRSWTVQATLARPTDLAVDWAIEAAPTRVGPWVTLADGRHEASDAGTWTLHVADTADLFGTDLEGSLEIDYGYESLDGGAPKRLVRVAHEPEIGASGPLREWAMYGEHGFSWSGLLQVTDDGQAWPGVAIVFHVAEGGRGEGFVVRDSVEIHYTICWDAAGDTVYRAANEGIATVGDESACAVGSLLD